MYTAISIKHFIKTIQTDISDHLGVTLTVKNSKVLLANKTETSYRYTNSAIIQMQEALKLITWRQIMENKSGEESLKFLQEKLETLVDSLCKTKLKPNKKGLWMTKQLKQLQKKKHKMLAKWQKRKTDVMLKLDYKHAKKAFEQEFRKARKQYYNNLLQSNDSRKIWGAIKELTSTQKVKETVPDTLYYNNETYTGKDEVAAGLNSYFKNIALDIQKKLPEITVDPLMYTKKAKDRKSVV